jgi:hypothetical protein
MSFVTKQKIVKKIRISSAININLDFLKYFFLYLNVYVSKWSKLIIN